MRTCSKCGGLNDGKQAYCPDCWRIYDAGRKRALRARLRARKEAAHTLAAIALLSPDGQAEHRDEIVRLFNENPTLLPKSPLRRLL
jgi:hypothetical protein